MSKNIIITGASAGFGKLTALTLLEKGHNVVASMRNIDNRNKDVASELKRAGAEVVEMDVTNEQSVNTAIEKSIKLLGNIDVVINNAGIGVSGMQEHFTIDDFQNVFDVNVFGVQRVNRAVLPHMRANKNGMIIYISSLLGRFSLPFYGPYNASKWALEALAENYRMELKPFGIENIIVEPGGYPTSFFNSLITPSDNSRIESYGELMNVPHKMTEGFMKALESTPDQKPEDVSNKILEIIDSPKESRKFRYPVDRMGMKTPISKLNDQLEEIMQKTMDGYGLSFMLN